MREVVLPRYGPPGIFELRERSDPQPGAGEIRIRVRAAGVNFADVLARLGLYPDAPPPPLVVGYEVAGTVDRCAPGGGRFAPGDRVLALTRFGGYADTVVVPAAQAFAIPRGLSDAEAAAVPVNYLTAALALYRLANLTAGETVLIHGAGGGVGIAAMHLSRLRRATIIGTASSAKHAALLAQGIDHIFDPSRLPVEEEVARLTGGRGVDVALDPLGGASYRRSYAMLAPLGRLVMLGVSSIAQGETRRWWRVFVELAQMPRFRPLSLINRNRGVFGLNLAHLWDERARLSGLVEMLLDELAAGRLRPVIAATFPLERAADAHRYMQRRANIGKIVLTVEEGPEPR